MTKIGFITLGCPKNQVDSEMMLAKLSGCGDFELCDDPYLSDVIVINTCAFIEDAKKEAIETILEMAELKSEDPDKKIIVMGCLAERYKDEIKQAIPEADIIAGLGANGEIEELCRAAAGGEAFEKFPPKEEMPLEGERILTTPPYWAYLKISDGCDNRCSYCAIPGIRGPMRSREVSGIVQEAKKLAAEGVKELILVSQDTTRYGEDVYGVPMLPELLKMLAEIEDIKWIRLLYCYPDRISDKLLETIENEPKILNYIDIPVQHADGRVLSRMNRKGDKETLIALVKKIRSRLPDVVLRTTLMAGFPGESEEEFESLCEFVREARFDRLGCFPYSQEEGTPAAMMSDQVDEETRKRRAEIIMEEQDAIFEERLRGKIGSHAQVIVEGYDAYSDSYYGRTWMDAPEIDSAIKFTSGYELNDGDIVDVEIFDVIDFDFIGETV